MNKRRKRWLGAGICLILALIFGLVIRGLSTDLVDQQMAERWSENGGVSQVSCYFSDNMEMKPETLIGFARKLDAALLSESITSESENPGARLWADCYSADGQITLTGRNNSITVDALGIGGDFFLFHPYTLLSGSYFSGNDLMQDYCVIDEIAAWQLFGSNDVAGQMITISGIPHMISGVIARPEGDLYEAAGLTGSLAYVSYSTLEKYGRSNGINHYEVVMPNPVPGYALSKVTEGFGDQAQEVEIIENTTRFSFLRNVQLLTKLGTRSMNGKAIIYPFWENVARGYEDIVGVVTFVMLLCLVYPIGLTLVSVVIWWRKRTWTWKDAAKLGIRKVGEFFRGLRSKRKAGADKRKEKKRKKELEDIDPYFEEDEDEEEMDKQNRHIDS